MMIAHSRIKAQRAHSTALSRESFSRAPRIVLRAVTPEQVGLGFVLLAPGTAALIYSAIRGKGNVGDGFSHLLTIVSQGYLQPEAGGKDIPVATGDLSEFGDSYIGFLYNIFLKVGGLYRLSFGPKSFIIVSDPTVAKFVLREAPEKFSKGVLAEILEPIMGKGLIPADLETWKVRRRAIVPAFHQAYLHAMVNMFGSCTARTVDKLNAAIDNGTADRINMEDEFLSLGLDIIGLGVFNYDFGSVTKESPIIKAVYRCLREAEHRSTFYLPYWNIPFSDLVVPRLREFKANMVVIDRILDELISLAVNTKQEDDIEALQARDYDNVKDPSLLRFLVDMRGADTEDKQLRDDLMTLLIAGHETTAAALTWGFYSLAQAPSALKELQEEVDRVVGDRRPSWDDVKNMPFLRNVCSRLGVSLHVAVTVAESLRMYPQPPVLIRRATEEVTLPAGSTAMKGGVTLQPGCDMFISTWNLHRSPHLWENPDQFDPTRFTRAFSNPDMPAWEGFDPKRSPGNLYTNETSADFAYIPFGGGSRKCVGDQFAMLEAAVAFAMLVRRFNIELADDPKDIKMTTGATIHTQDGLFCKVSRRSTADGALEEKEVTAAV